MKKQYEVRFPKKIATQYMYWQFGAKKMHSVFPKEKTMVEKIAAFNGAEVIASKTSFKIIGFDRLYKARNFATCLRVLNAWNLGKRGQPLDDGGIFLN